MWWLFLLLAWLTMPIILGGSSDKGRMMLRLLLVALGISLICYGTVHSVDMWPWSLIISFGGGLLSGIGISLTND